MLLDALIVRTVVVPALAFLLGERFWWPAHPDPATSPTPGSPRPPPGQAPVADAEPAASSPWLRPTEFRTPRGVSAEHLAVVGANGRTGRLVVRQALAASPRRPAGRRTTRSTRDTADRGIGRHAPRERPERGFKAEVVISTYDVRYSRQPITVYSGVQRRVCLTSTTEATESAPGDGLLWRRVVRPLLRHVMSWAAPCTTTWSA